MRKITMLILLLGGWATVSVGGWPPPGAEVYRPFDEGKWLFEHRLPADVLIDSTHSFDVLHYNIVLFIDFDTESIDGYTIVTSEAKEADLSTIDLDFTILTVDSVFGETGGLAYTHVDPVLTVDLGQAYALGDTFEVQVFYHGQPGNEGADGFGGFYFEGVPVKAFQMGVGLEADPSSMGKYWFPCWDWPEY